MLEPPNKTFFFFLNKSQKCWSESHIQFIWKVFASRVFILPSAYQNKTQHSLKENNKIQKLNSVITIMFSIQSKISRHVRKLEKVLFGYGTPSELMSCVQRSFLQGCFWSAVFFTQTTTLPVTVTMVLAVFMPFQVLPHLVCWGRACHPRLLWGL